MAKILIVEDDSDLASRLSQWLVHERHSVEVTASGQDALNFLKTYTFDLIILDWILPEVSGVEICKNFRASGGKSPVLMLTRKGDVVDKETGLDAGADDYLSKPFHPRELSARVKALLRRQPQYSPEMLIAGEITLNRTSHVVTSGGEQVKLLPLEFSLLEFLLRHPKQVFSKDALLERVWPAQSEASLEAVRTCIKSLRKKIDSRTAHPLIRNIHGVGYMLDPPDEPQNR